MNPRQFPFPFLTEDRRTKNHDPHSPRGAPRGYSRPPAAVTSRHQRVAGGRVTSYHNPPGPGHNRCRRQVAPFHVVGRPRDEISSTLRPNNVKDGTPARRAHTTPGGLGGNIRRSTFDLRLIGNGNGFEPQDHRARYPRHRQDPRTSFFTKRFDGSRGRGTPPAPCGRRSNHAGPMWWSWRQPS